MSQPTIMITPLCEACQRDLVHGAGYSPDDSWRVLIIAAQVALFQGAMSDDVIRKKLDADVTRVPELGCLGCALPAQLHAITMAGKSKDIGKIKALGEQWVEEANARLNPKKLDG